MDEEEIYRADAEIIVGIYNESADRMSFLQNMQDSGFDFREAQLIWFVIERRVDTEEQI